MISSRIIEKIVRYIHEGYWLDVGFGNGSLLLTAHEYGFTPIGLDVRNKNIVNMRKLGIECYHEDIENFHYSKSFSVITMADVLEHTKFPIKAIKAVRNLIKKNGLIFISMPNIESKIWDITTENKSNPYWGEIEHFHNFGKTRLYKFLNEYGFKVVYFGISERYRMCMEIIAIPTNK